MSKTITLIIIIISFFVGVSEIHHGFKQTKFLYALYFDRSTIQEDVLIEKKRYNVDGEATDLYYIEGYLKENKVKKTISGYMPCLDKDENGNFLVWYCNFKNISYTLTREKEEDQIPFFYFNPWFHFVLLVLFIPLLLYYLKLKILEKNKK
ncbi:hypothetical protein ACE1MK_05565 [Tenacibaculum maritimum]|uniref:hypothetical protein n=1 Tax=Tenacibaculum maritimum TaxID=107401 RepID=UPI0012E4F417|nr:hypothetical protein [Tenacibaculum maritimum]CAA0249443.1 hypothetical protein USCSP91_70007 [Tenacibaculum maritimum]